MGVQPGDYSDDQTFSLPNHQKLNLSDQDCAEKRLNDLSTPPTISEHECYLKIKEKKKLRSVMPGDLPSSIVKEFAVELANTLSKLCNNILQSTIWPQQWKVEYVIPIGKIPSPEREDDLRPISLTAFSERSLSNLLSCGCWSLLKTNWTSDSMEGRRATPSAIN